MGTNRPKPRAGERAPVKPDEVAPPSRGFGQLWRKSYEVDLTGITASPEAIITDWKANFDAFWPHGNRLHAALRTLRSADLVEMDLALPLGGTMASGIAVLFSRADAFALITPQGHMFSGWIAFSAHADGDARSARIDILMRASDPLFEIGMILMGHRQEDQFWTITLRRLAAHWGLQREPTLIAVKVDDHRQWRHAVNIWHNAAIRSLFGRGASPVRAILRRRRRT